MNLNRSMHRPIFEKKQSQIVNPFNPNMSYTEGIFKSNNEFEEKDSNNNIMNKRKFTSHNFRKKESLFYFNNNSNTNITINNNNILIKNKNMNKNKSYVNSDDEDEDVEVRDSEVNFENSSENCSPIISPKLKSMPRRTKVSANNFFNNINTIEEYPINCKLKSLVAEFPSKEDTKPKSSILNLFNFAINANYFLLYKSDFSIAEQYFLTTKHQE